MTEQPTPPLYLTVEGRRSKGTNLVKSLPLAFSDLRPEEAVPHPSEIAEQVVADVVHLLRGVLKANPDTKLRDVHLFIDEEPEAEHPAGWIGRPLPGLFGEVYVPEATHVDAEPITWTVVGAQGAERIEHRDPESGHVLSFSIAPLILTLEATPRGMVPS